MLYGTECWAVKKQHFHKMSVVEMRMLRWISGTQKDLNFIFYRLVCIKSTNML